MLNPVNRGLYAITDGPHADLLARAAAILGAGAAMLQYRDKTHDTARRLTEAHALQALCRRHDVPLIVNDDVDLAVAVGAAGVHLGADDADITSARQVLGADALIGVSCYDSLDRARKLAAQAPDYLAFGSFFASPTKPAARRADVDTLREARRLGLALVAIGGITPENGAALVQAGADYLAVISGVFGAADPAAATRAYIDLFRTR